MQAGVDAALAPVDYFGLEAYDLRIHVIAEIVATCGGQEQEQTRKEKKITMSTSPDCVYSLSRTHS